VINRFQFKQDEAGYLGKRRRHLYVLDIATGTATILTPGDYDEFLPAWSPDGRSLAFVSKRRPHADRDNNWDLYVIDVAPGSAPRQLTTFAGADNDPETGSRPAWSPDGRSIAYLQGGPPRLIYYAVQTLAVVSAAGGAPRLLTAPLDRTVSNPTWSADGASMLFQLEDDRTVELARIAASGGAIEHLVAGPRVVTAYATAPDGRIAVAVATPQAPAEVYALDRGGLRPLSHQNDAWLAPVKLAATEPISFRSRDGTPVNGFVVKPPDSQAGRRYPAILRIHGGPVSQFQYDFSHLFQVLAARGYLVVVANPRGSAGRGTGYASAIYADWGHKDAEDVLAAVDYVVARGLADPARLGVGGWSYGGILTNYVIAQDRRFKAAVSGASASNILAGYGTDEYVREYEAELGVPWQHPDTWLKLSFPFLHADRIVTPTLFLCGDKDFNVPLLNSEQMYQALKSLGVETELVIYPGQYHVIHRPSYLRDRLERYLAWYDRHLQPLGAVRADRLLDPLQSRIRSVAPTHFRDRFPLHPHDVRGEVEASLEQARADAVHVHGDILFLELPDLLHGEPARHDDLHVLEPLAVQGAAHVPHELGVHPRRLERAHLRDHRRIDQRLGRIDAHAIQPIAEGARHLE
jgi:dipeptidyl aminopeptidase/acylaminoacyl peptidase